MYLLSWLIIGSIIGWSTVKLLTAGGYEPILDTSMAIAGAIGGVFIMCVASSFPAHSGLHLTSMAAVWGAVLVTALSGFANGGRRYAYVRQRS